MRIRMNDSYKTYYPVLYGFRDGKYIVVCLGFNNELIRFDLKCSLLACYFMGVLAVDGYVNLTPFAWEQCFDLY